MDKLVDEYNNTYHLSIDGKSVDPGCSALTKEIETNPISSEFKVAGRVRIIKYGDNVSISKDYTENWSREIFVIGSVLKTNPGTLN